MDRHLNYVFKKISHIKMIQIIALLMTLRFKLELV